MPTRIRRMFAAAIFVTLLPLGVAGAADSPVEATAKKMLSLLESLADVIAGNADNCTTMATEIDKFGAKHGDELKALKEEGKKYTPEEKKAIKDKYKDRFEGIMKKMGPGIQKCGKDEKVKAAMEKVKP